MWWDKPINAVCKHNGKWNKAEMQQLNQRTINDLPCALTPAHILKEQQYSANNDARPTTTIVEGLIPKILPFNYVVQEYFLESN